jgi:uncharacterized RDD family membrane protein YckC
MVDTCLQLAALIVLGIALSALGAAASVLPVERGEPFFVLILAVFGLAVLAITSGYFILFEIIWNGQSPGKRLVGVRVMRENGYPVRPVDSVIRNLVRIVDWLPALYGLGVMTMLVNRRSRRLGDFASGTIVVRESSGAAAGLVVPAPGPVEPRGYVLSRGDATLVRDFLTRRDSMDPASRAALGQRLASALAARYGLSEGPDPERFLDELAA